MNGSHHLPVEIKENHFPAIRPLKKTVHIQILRWNPLRGFSRAPLSAPFTCWWSFHRAFGSRPSCHSMSKGAANASGWWTRVSLEAAGVVQPCQAGLNKWKCAEENILRVVGKGRIHSSCLFHQKKRVRLLDGSLCLTEQMMVMLLNCFQDGDCFWIGNLAGNTYCVFLLLF